jgi:hypothetical protein
MAAVQAGLIADTDHNPRISGGAWFIAARETVTAIEAPSSRSRSARPWQVGPVCAATRTHTGWSACRPQQSDQRATDCGTSGSAEDELNHHLLHLRPVEVAALRA